jgi:hypothetical protein
MNSGKAAGWTTFAIAALLLILVLYVDNYGR